MSAILSLEQQEELASEYFGRYDYLSEAYGAEARLLAQQDADEAAYWAEEAEKEEAAKRGISREDLRAFRAQEAQAREDRRKCEGCMTRIGNFFLPF